MVKVIHLSYEDEGFNLCRQYRDKMMVYNTRMRNVSKMKGGIHFAKVDGGEKWWPMQQVIKGEGDLIAKNWHLWERCLGFVSEWIVAGLWIKRAYRGPMMARGDMVIDCRGTTPNSRTPPYTYLIFFLSTILVSHTKCIGINLFCKKNKCILELLY